MRQLQTIRGNARKNSRQIIDYLIGNYIIRPNGRAKVAKDPPICLFCGSTAKITREHVLPRWAYEKKTDKFFVSTINGLSHTYNKTTIPACTACNSTLLSELERHIAQLFSTHKLPLSYFDDTEAENIIRWLEIVDYKYQIFSLTTNFRASKKVGYIEYLADFSLSVLDPNIDYSPSRTITGLRQSLKRISTKSKTQYLNSLVIFKTSNKEMSFFHKNNDFIFLELPQKGLALFYFLQKTFKDAISARDEALLLIKEHY